MKKMRRLQASWTARGSSQRTTGKETQADLTDKTKRPALETAANSEEDGDIAGNLKCMTIAISAPMEEDATQHTHQVPRGASEGKSKTRAYQHRGEHQHGTGPSKNTNQNEPGTELGRPDQTREEPVEEDRTPHATGIYVLDNILGDNRPGEDDEHMDDTTAMAEMTGGGMDDDGKDGRDERAPTDDSTGTGGARREDEQAEQAKHARRPTDLTDLTDLMGGLSNNDEVMAMTVQAAESGQATVTGRELQNDAHFQESTRPHAHTPRTHTTHAPRTRPHRG